MIRKIALLVIILLMATPVVAQEQKPKNTLVIAISKDFEPFTFLNAEGKPAGMFVDIWRLWAQKTGKQIAFISSDWKTSLENLKNEKADIHSGFLYSPEHFKWISVSQPFYEVGVSLFYPLKQGKVSDINELSGQTVAAIRGSQLEQFLKKNYPGIRIYPCDTRADLAKVSREGKTRGFVATWPVGSTLIDRMGLSGEFEMYNKIFYKEKFNSGVLKNNTELLALVDQGFNAMSYQELAEIEARWIPDPAKRYYKTSNIIQLTPAEEAWLRSHKTIRVGMSPIFPPLKFSEKGVIKGIEPDYLNLLSEYTGIQFEYVVCDFSVMDAKVKSGEIDMFISFNIPERLAYMTFTEPLMEFKRVIIARRDAPFMSGMGALKGKKVATVRGVKLYDKILSTYPDIEAVQVGTMEEMFKAVSESKADALFSQTYFAGYVIQNYPNLKIAGVANLPPEPYLYAVRKDYPELVGILNKAITSIPRDKHDAIVQRWFSVRVEYRPNWSEILKWVFVVGGAFTLILGLSLFWNRRLAREIEKRKQAEEAINKLNAELEQRVLERTAQLSAANKELESFSYSVSHDLRAPLRSIDGFSHALLEEYGNKLDDMGKTYLERVRKATQKMGFLIDDMLKLLKVIRAEFHIESVDLSSMTRTIAEELQTNNPDRAVDVIIQDGIVVQGDHYMMKIVLENLMDNAWKFIGSKALPKIEFGTTVTDDVLVKSRLSPLLAGGDEGEGGIRKSDGEKTIYFVRDNGAGFDMAYVNKIFGAFQRLHTTDQFPGTGIGLATVQRIIHRHGGQVWAEGEIGKGATFYFTLPSQVVGS
jgi:ABC-type amino acid transport substrate-binding protein/nitrogen-specific signal transduction histidine kinase